MSEGVAAVKEVRKFIEKVPDLTITDVPKETKRWFIDFANSDEFKCSKNKSGHYGFALKFLCDFFRGRLVDGSAIAEAKADEALSQIAEMKSQPESEEVIHTVGGRRIVKRSD